MYVNRRKDAESERVRRKYLLTLSARNGFVADVLLMAAIMLMINIAGSGIKASDLLNILFSIGFATLVLSYYYYKKKLV
ncbi:hypothetical protein CUJ83_13790 [Methanocella sp. CWC-04]|uniref:Uncharacterized protein n=1 Tax=Methanooceanicella nereidis TaxID=2052831 RepID=A0AAP2W5Y0_9EURY|nr:hypothetical protein [Methanocella sp. CWC-04]MCD1296070.1 hypothetical protein [Methanocella sp. CWC-04]